MAHQLFAGETSQTQKGIVDVQELSIRQGGDAHGIRIGSKGALKLLLGLAQGGFGPDMLRYVMIVGDDAAHVRVLQEIGDDAFQHSHEPSLCLARAIVRRGFPGLTRHSANRSFTLRVSAGWTSESASMFRISAGVWPRSRSVAA